MIRVLGPVTVVGPDERTVPLSDRQRSLVASLVARAGTVVPVDTLVELVWPDAPPDDPVAALHNQMSRLRRAVPFARVETVAPVYRLLEELGLKAAKSVWPLPSRGEKSIYDVSHTLAERSSRELNTPELRHLRRAPTSRSSSSNNSFASS